jgi:integrase
MHGHIEKRGNDSWRLTVSDGLDSQGKQIRYRKTIQAKKEKAAEKELALMIAEIEKGQFISTGKLTFADFIDRWFKSYADINLAPKTLHRYRQMLDSRIIPILGHYKMDKLRPVHLLDFCTFLRNEDTKQRGKSGKLSDMTILHHFRLVSAILQTALQWQVISFNPAKNVKAPKVKRMPGAYYDEGQTAALLEAVENDPIIYKVLIYLAISTGLRRGELMGLEWDDINFDKTVLTVKRASQYLPGKGTFTKDPKNESSKRVVSLPSSIIVLLKEYRREQLQERLRLGDMWQDSNRIFTTWDGRPMHPDTPSNWFPKFLKRNNLPHIPFHGLRHTAATLLIDKGLNIKAVSARLGHTQASTTINIYTHALKSADRKAADMMEDVFTGNIKRQA